MLLVLEVREVGSSCPNPDSTGLESHQVTIYPLHALKMSNPWCSEEAPHRHMMCTAMSNLPSWMIHWHAPIIDWNVLIPGKSNSSLVSSSGLSLGFSGDGYSFGCSPNSRTYVDIIFSMYFLGRMHKHPPLLTCQMMYSFRNYKTEEQPIKKEYDKVYKLDTDDESDVEKVPV